MKNILKLSTLSCIVLFGLGFISSCGGDDPEPITITINNFSASLAENPDNGDIIGTLSASANRGEITYAITSQNPSGAIELNETTGQITVKNRGYFNYEVRTSITASFSATTEAVTETADITITITDVLETVQQRLNSGELPSSIVGSGVKIDSLYGKTFQGGAIVHYYSSGGASGDCIIMHSERIGSSKTQSEANTLAQNLSAGGRTDWRLPTDAEKNLFCANITADNQENLPPLFPTVNEYWTGTNCGGICYRTFFLQTGSCSGGGSPSSSQLGVLAVRVYRQPA